MAEGASRLGHPYEPGRLLCPRGFIRLVGGLHSVALPETCSAGTDRDPARNLLGRARGIHTRPADPLPKRQYDLKANPGNPRPHRRHCLLTTKGRATDHAVASSASLDLTTAESPGPSNGAHSKGPTTWTPSQIHSRGGIETSTCDRREGPVAGTR